MLSSKIRGNQLSKMETLLYVTFNTRITIHTHTHNIIIVGRDNIEKM